MPRYRRHSRESTTHTVLAVAVGALAGFAAGVLVAEKFGGFSALVDRVRGRTPKAARGTRRDATHLADDETLDGDDEGGFDFDDEGVEEGTALQREMEERVLSAFTNDPVLGERAIDIGALSDTAIELTGWVRSEHEGRHAVTIARGVPGVETVVNRILVGDQETTLTESVRFQEDDEFRAAHERTRHERVTDIGTVGARAGGTRKRPGGRADTRDASRRTPKADHLPEPDATN